jgi:hypothetical protein
MREDIAEQLGVTPTPGGLEVLLRQSENNRMASGGIVNMANGGSAIKEFGQILKGVAPSAIAGGITGGLFPIMKWGANQLAGNYGGTGIRQRLLNELSKNYDPFGDGAMTTDQYYDAIDNIENMSTDQLQKEIEGYQVGEGTLPAQDMSAGMSGASALMAMPTYGAMLNVGGSSGMGKGAGGNFGQSQRMIRKENRKLNRLIDRFADTPFAQTVMNFVNRKKEQGFGSGAYDAFDRVAANAPKSAADSRGRPQNWSKIYAHYQQTGSFEDSPEAQWGGG